MRQRIFNTNPMILAIQLQLRLTLLFLISLFLISTLGAQEKIPIYSQTYVNDTHPTSVEVTVYNNLKTDAKTIHPNASNQLTSQTVCNFDSEIYAENITQGGSLDTTGCSSNDSLQICFRVNYYGDGGSNQFFHGLVPDFGNCLNVYPTAEGEPGYITVPMTNVTGTGQWQWFPDGVVTYNDVPDDVYNPGDPVGAGWFYNFRPGSNPTCTDYYKLVVRTMNQSYIILRRSVAKNQLLQMILSHLQYAQVIYLN